MQMRLEPKDAVFEFASADLRKRFCQIAVDHGWSPGARGFGDGPVCALRAITSADLASIWFSSDFVAIRELHPILDEMVASLYRGLSMARLHAIGLPVPVPASGEYAAIPPGLWSALRFRFADAGAECPGARFSGVQIYDNFAAAQEGIRWRGQIPLDARPSPSGAGVPMLAGPPLEIEAPRPADVVPASKKPLTDREVLEFLKRRGVELGQPPAKETAWQDALEQFPDRNFRRKWFFKQHESVFGRQPPGPRKKINSTK